MVQYECSMVQSAVSYSTWCIMVQYSSIGQPTETFRLSRNWAWSNCPLITAINRIVLPSRSRASRMCVNVRRGLPSPLSMYLQGEQANQQEACAVCTTDGSNTISTSTRTYLSMYLVYERVYEYKCIVCGVYSSGSRCRHTWSSSPTSAAAPLRRIPAS
jgi:hypothetical protein